MHEFERMGAGRPTSGMIVQQGQKRYRTGAPPALYRIGCLDTTST
jgi:hypothetical protein